MSSSADIFVQPATAGKIDVLVQEQCQLEINTSLLYVKSGQKEIQDYVDNVSKPEIDSYIETEAKPIVSEVVSDISEPQINEYVETTVKPTIDEYVLTEVKPLSDNAAESASNASQSATVAAGYAAAASSSANSAESSKTAAAESASAAEEAVNGFDEHVAVKQAAFDENAAGKTDSFNAHVAVQTTDFDEHFAVKQSAFDENATEKTNDFNANAAAKQSAVDGSAVAAEASAQAAAGSAANAEKWATGTIDEQPEGSAEYWAGIAKGQTLPEQSGHAGKWLGTDGSVASWKEIDFTYVKKIGFEHQRVVQCSGSVTLPLNDQDEVVCCQITDNVDIYLDFSGLSFIEKFFTTQLCLSFPNGAKTVTLALLNGHAINWINALTPDFSSGKEHWLVLRAVSGSMDVTMSDAGEVG